MNDGSLVVTTSTPLKNPVARVISRATPIAGRIVHPNPPASTGVTSIMIAIPPNPTSEPTDRSNSPAIISRATAIARIPSGAARLRIAATVTQLMKLLSAATTAKNSQTTTNATRAPSSGRASNLDRTPISRTLSSAAAGAGCVFTANGLTSSPGTLRSLRSHHADGIGATGWPGPGAPAIRISGQRRPFSEKAITSPAVSAVTIWGPVRITRSTEPRGRAPVSRYFVNSTIGR